MNSTSLLAITIFLCGVSNAGTIQAQQTPIPTPEISSERKVVETTLHSAILSEERRVLIHLPRHYALETAQKYPVMYVLDGTSQDQHTADKVAILADAGLIPNAIVVGLPNTRGNRERDQTPPFMRRDVADEKSALGAGDKFLSFIEKELIPYVESNYRTSGYRTLSGNSRGGLLVWYSLLAKPDLFQARFCYSTPVWRFENMMVGKMAAFLHSASGLKTFLYMSVGDEETDQMKDGFAKMMDVLKKNRLKTFKWTANYTPHAVHQDNAMISTSKGLVEWGKYLKETGTKQQ
jgi:predicted alpha/beta superfamily hydrolase